MANPELFTGLGAAFSIFLSCAGSCIASVPAGIFAIQSKSIKGFGPIVIAGVLAIYGLIVAVLVSSKLMGQESSDTVMTVKEGYMNFAAGLSVGFACLTSGIGMSNFLWYSLAPYYSNNSSGRSLSTVAPVTGTQSSESEIPLLASNSNIAAAAIMRNHKPEFTFQFFMVMVYLEAIGLYGLIVALLLTK